MPFFPSLRADQRHLGEVQNSGVFGEIKKNSGIPEFSPQHD